MANEFLDPAGIVDATELVAYWDVDAQDLVVARCADVGWATLDSEAKFPLGRSRAHVEVTLHLVAGLPVVVYGAQGEVGVLRCSDPLCREEAARVVLPTGQVQPLFMSVAVSAEGHLAATYMDRDGWGPPWLLRCLDRNCERFTTERLPAATQPGPGGVAFHGGELIVAIPSDPGEPLVLARPG